MVPLDEIVGVLNMGAEAMGNKEFERAIPLYREGINCLHEWVRDALDKGQPADDLMWNMGNAYCDLAGCLVEICGTDISECAHAITSALLCGCTSEALKPNLLWCMRTANLVMQARHMDPPNIDRQADFIRWQRQGYDLLKTPDPPGTGDRNWQGAANSYWEAIKLWPESAASYHGLGLALEGLKRDEEAVEAWKKVKLLDFSYDFNFRSVCR